MAAYHPGNHASNFGERLMSIDENDGIAAHLGGLAAAYGSPERVAAAVAATFRGIDQVLSPIVGPRGVAALYKRSLHLARPAFPWLPEISAGTLVAVDIGPLTKALNAQNAAEAASAGARVLSEFRGLLTTLIGHSLAERLLRSVWAAFSSSPPARDNTP